MGLFGIGNKKKPKTIHEQRLELCRKCKHDSDGWCVDCDGYYSLKLNKTGTVIASGSRREHHTHNKDYAELVEFDKGKLGYLIRKRLRLYVEAKGTYHLDYYIAKLSHEIFKTHGVRGHTGREQIRKGLKDYAWQVLRERRN
jgi:hypothetical protein